MAPKQAEEIEHGGSASEAGLFQGRSFWLSHNVPQRSRFKELVEENGGIVRLLEKDADILIVDHKRKNLPPNTYSYQFIEKSIQRGILQDLDDYKAGPSSMRPVGATNVPTRGHRLAYTTQDDQFLYDYMQPYERSGGASIRGNKIYQELAAQNPRHTYQSWRDRYLKRVRGQPRPGGKLETASTTTASEEAPRDPHPGRDTPHRSREATQRNERLQRPEEKKRKRSPEATVNGHHSKSPSSAQQRVTPRSPAKRPEAVIAPPELLTRRRRPSHTEVPPSPKKAKTTTKPAPEKPKTPEPSQQADTGIDSVFLELPFLPSPPRFQESPKQDVDSWIDERLRMGKGSEEQIINALCCASMDPTLADVVLDSLVSGSGIPTDMRGVWTEEDDRCLEAADTRDIQRIIEKHGPRLNDRWDYLNLTRE
ncbi:Rap1 Myb domain-containing protein [Aspergillus unguis]